MGPVVSEGGKRHTAVLRALTRRQVDDGPLLGVECGHDGHGTAHTGQKRGQNRAKTRQTGRPNAPPPHSTTQPKGPASRAAARRCGAREASPPPGPTCVRRGAAWKASPGPGGPPKTCTAAWQTGGEGCCVSIKLDWTGRLCSLIDEETEVHLLTPGRPGVHLTACAYFSRRVFAANSA